MIEILIVSGSVILLCGSVEIYAWFKKRINKRNMTIAEKIYDFMHIDKAWIGRMEQTPARPLKDRSESTQNRYKRLAEFVRNFNNG